MYAEPLHLWDSSSKVLANLTTSFTFIIDKVNDTSYGDGFAFYLAPLGYQIPPNSAGSTDPPMKHVGIDDNSLTSVAFAMFDIDNNIGNPCHALITYTASTNTLVVSWYFHGNTSKNTSINSSLSYQVDFTKILPEWVNVGFSASTSLAT
ncbi:mannose/glucose-specific lectin Cramoll-like [Gastrolobium bilobum]|uniref:mannose/glucose-specific lectin Cramoll-like n=1 Tax=Gastrolobium bilobum TaxID=150636 RepID=UPI002AB2321B|nr:mannose/glucose-specific lectin Cramoll-like [Gastrolobium bilobum]